MFRKRLLSWKTRRRAREHWTPCTHAHEPHDIQRRETETERSSLSKGYICKYLSWPLQTRKYQRGRRWKWQKLPDVSWMIFVAAMLQNLQSDPWMRRGSIDLEPLLPFSPPVSGFQRRKVATASKKWYVQSSEPALAWSSDQSLPQQRGTSSARPGALSTSVLW